MMIQFASAYRQLQPAERTFVDGVIRFMEREAAVYKERITTIAQDGHVQSLVMERDTRNMLQKPLVAAAIRERIDEIGRETELTPSTWLKEQISLAFSSMGDYCTVDDATGVPVFDLSKCTPEQWAAIKTLKVTEEGDGLTRPMKRKLEIVLHDKQVALMALGKYMGMMEGDNPHWRADRNAATVPQIAIGDSAETAGDKYAEMLGEG